MKELLKLMGKNVETQSVLKAKLNIGNNFFRTE
jgi:hypothetical protein